MAYQDFAQVMRHRRPEAEAQTLATLVAGSTAAKVKAEKSAKARGQRKVVLDQLEGLQ